MNTLRQIMTILLIPLYLLAGAFVAGQVENITGIWHYYIGALILPVFGLVGTKYVAPFYKAYNIITVYILGMVLAYAFSFPAYYPENHEQAYMPTYVPFIITTLLATALLVILVALENFKAKP